MEVAYKFRLYPNSEQKNLIARTLGCCRYVYNRYLALRKETYEKIGETMNYYACAKDLTALKQKEETQWLREVEAHALQNALRDLDNAYQNFFRGIQKGKKRDTPVLRASTPTSSPTRAIVGFAFWITQFSSPSSARCLANSLVPYRGRSSLQRYP